MSEDEKYERYMVFEFDDHYPFGGLSDCKGDFPEKQQAFDFIEKLAKSHGHRGLDNIELFDRVEGVEIDIEISIFKKE